MTIFGPLAMSDPSAAMAMPLPSPETTPPVTTMYFVGIFGVDEGVVKKGCGFIVVQQKNLYIVVC